MNLDFNAAFLNVAILCILTVPHEFAHAWMASKLGDDTPENEGRLTLYPPAHIDLLGTIILPAITSLLGAGFLGWGRPVNTNIAKLKGGLNGLAIVALAGPISNVILAVIFAALFMSVGRYLPEFQFLGRAAALSIYLAVFNMIPVPPLDGSKLLIAAKLPLVIYAEIARFGFMFLILIMSFTDFGFWLNSVSSSITQSIFAAFYWMVPR